MSDRLTAHLSGPLGGTVAAPGDKSISHRALILGGLAEGTTEIAGLLEGDDVLATAAALAKFGATVKRLGPGQWRVAGARWRSPDGPIDCGNSGTACRLLMGAAAAFPLTATFTGDASLSRRPMARVTGPLAAMGARFDGGPTLPITLHGGALTGIDYVAEVASAQVKSAVLLAGLGASGPVSVTEPTPTRDHTERMLLAFSVEIAPRHTERGGGFVLGEYRKLRATPIDVPGDPSSAAFPLAAGLVVPGSMITVERVLLNPLRTGLFNTLIEMGARLDIAATPGGGEPVGTLTATAGPLTGIEVPPTRAASMIDEYPVLAAVAAFARGTTVMRGVGELRVKEGDRIALMIAGLRACGVQCEDGPDWFAVHGCDGAPPGAAEVETAGDHRIAMAFLVLGLGGRAPVTVRDAGMIATSFPGFAGLMRSLGADLREAA